MFSRTVPRTLRFVRPLRTTSATVAPQTRAGTLALAPAPARAPYFHCSSSVHITFANSFTSSVPVAKGLQPGAEDPQPPNVQSTLVGGAAAHYTEPSPLTPEEFHDYSEHYFNVLLGHLEKAQEEGSDVEAEYSVSLVAVISPSIPLFQSFSPLISPRKLNSMVD